MSIDTSLVNRKRTALASMGRLEVSDFETLAAFAAEGLKGLLPLRVRRPIRWLIPR